MNELVKFLHGEQAQSETIPIIIAKGGCLHNFPILLANCVKHSCDKFGILIVYGHGQNANSSGLMVTKEWPW